jgi:hypothetical protein
VTKWFDTHCFGFDSEAIAIEVLDKLFTHALSMKEIEREKKKKEWVNE